RDRSTWTKQSDTPRSCSNVQPSRQSVGSSPAEFELAEDMNKTDPLTEFGLIDWIRQRAKSLRSPYTDLGIGDDCAILDVASASSLLVTTDMLRDGRHFRLEQDWPEAVGYKSLAVNLSDIAAMAGVPRAAVVAVALPQERAVELGRGIYAGMESLAGRFHVDL